MTPLLRYTLARIGLFAAAVAVGSVAGLRGLTLWVSAILLSGVASWFLLSRLRDAAGVRIEQRITAINDRIDASARKEDDD